MNSECLRIADQLRRAFNGHAWHGPSLREMLEGVTAEQARLRVLPAAHTIWEVVNHIGAWVDAANGAVHGSAFPESYPPEKDWPTVADGGDAAWKLTRERLYQSGDQLAQSIGSHGDEKLKDRVPGRPYNFYFLFHGVVQHSLFHGGQIAILKRAAAGS